MFSVEGTIAGSLSSSSVTPLAVPLDCGLVRDALREILDEIPAFRALAASNVLSTVPGGTNPGVTATSSSSLVSPKEGKSY